VVAIVDVFWSAFEAAAAVVASDEVRASWTTPSALDGYDVGGLVAHLFVATERTASVLEAEEPAGPGVVVVDVAGFYGPNRMSSPADRTAGLPAFLRDDGARRAAAGRDAVVDAFMELPRRLRPLLGAAAPDRLVPVVQVKGGAARLDDYLRTRVVELVVHTDDLLCSVALPAPELAEDVLDAVTSLFVELAVARAGGRGVLRGFARAERADVDVLRVL
jgi:hypothetical protein